MHTLGLLPRCREMLGNAGGAGLDVCRQLEHVVAWLTPQPFPWPSGHLAMGRGQKLSSASAVPVLTWQVGGMATRCA